MAGVDGAGGVGADELDVDLRAGPRRGGRTVGARLDRLDQHVVQPRVGQAEVHEPGAGHLDRLDVGGQIGLQALGHGHGQIARLPARLLGRGQGHVRRPVAVLAASRAFEVDLVGHGLDLERCSVARSASASWSRITERC